MLKKIMRDIGMKDLVCQNKTWYCLYIQFSANRETTPRAYNKSSRSLIENINDNI